jgi:hypothetical protein
VGGTTPLPAGILSGTFVSTEGTTEATVVFDLGARAAVADVFFVDFLTAPFAAFFVVFALLFAAFVPASVVALDFDIRLDTIVGSGANELEASAAAAAGATGRVAKIGFSACRRRSS